MGEPVYRGPCAPSRLVVDRAVAEEALELAIQAGMDRAAERFGVNRATLYNAWKRWGLARPTDRPDGVRLARERSLAAKVIPDVDHPWRTDRSIWQPRRTPERTAERTVGPER